MPSPRFSISPEQWMSIRSQIKKYIAPLILVFLLQLQQGRSIQEALPYVYSAGLVLGINIVSKFLSETK